MRSLRIYRVRWRGSWWQPTSATRVRYLGRFTDAERLRARLDAEGYQVELCRAERSPWDVITSARWTSEASR